MEISRIAEQTLMNFVVDVLTRVGVSEETAKLASRSMLDASLMGIDSHGVGALPMYVNHIQGGGLKFDAEPVVVKSNGGVEQWDMQHGFGMASGRKIMEHAITAAKRCGIYLATCRNTNHLGACGVYGKMAADSGCIAMVSQQTNLAFSPWGSTEPRIGASPFAFVAPVKDGFPFYYDVTIAAITRAKVKAHMQAGEPLPEGVALDADGNATVDPTEAWNGQLLPIGAHKGVGLAMAFEILSCVLSGNQFAKDVPSIVDNPDKSADSSLFMIVINPEAAMPLDNFMATMRRYIDYIESSPARDPDNPPRYPGRRAGQSWSDRSRNGIPVSVDVLDRLDTIAQSIGATCLER